MDKIEAHCTAILSGTECKKLPFHNLFHTQEVVNNVLLITEYLKMDPEEIEPIVIAAWFHDTGFSKIYFGHEEASKKLAEEYLMGDGYDTKKIETVLSCIEATKIPQQPKNEYAKVLCDADLFHIGTELFFCKKLLLRREWELENIKTYTDLEWHRLNLEFLEKHHFKTPYGKKILEPIKQNNLQKVKRILSYYEA